MTSRFTPGEKTVINKDYPNGCVLLKGDNVTVLDIYVVTVSGTKILHYDVRSSLGDEWTVIEADLDPIPVELTQGQQLLLGDVLESPKCDCGGYKVYGTMNAAAHSVWCSIFEVEK